VNNFCTEEAMRPHKRRRNKILLGGRKTLIKKERNMDRIHC
jgi:hypothetical protein